MGYYNVKARMKLVKEIRRYEVQIALVLLASFILLASRFL